MRQLKITKSITNRNTQPCPRICQRLHIDSITDMDSSLRWAEEECARTMRQEYEKELKKKANEKAINDKVQRRNSFLRKIFKKI